MQGNRLAGTRAIAQASRSDQFCQQLRVMLHLVLAAELRVFILERVVTMRARCHDLLRLVARKRLDIGLCELLVKDLIADATAGIARTAFLRADHSEIYLSFLQ